MQTKPQTPGQLMLQRHLAEAEGYVRNGARIVEQQRKLVVRLRAGGHDVSIPMRWLARFENIQSSYLEHRAMILREFEAERT